MRPQGRPERTAAGVALKATRHPTAQAAGALLAATGGVLGGLVTIAHFRAAEAYHKAPQTREQGYLHRSVQDGKPVIVYERVGAEPQPIYTFDGGV